MKGLPRTITEAAALLRRRETNALELVEIALRAAHADGFNTWLLVSDERATAQARAADERLNRGDAPLLCGIPWACKDIIGTKGVATTAGSKILEGYVPPYSATVVERLDAAGAVMLGKTNLDEFAMGSSNENSAFGPVKNPWRVDRVPGGSSGGSAVAVAAGEALFALGTDTGGSIRQPAALTGVVGMKPTYGRVSRYGVVAFASSLDQVGPFTNCVEDSAIVCQALFGTDPNDATTMPLPREAPGAPRGQRAKDHHPRVRPEVKRRMSLGTYALSAGYYDAYYVKAQKVRTLIKQEFDRVFEKVDAIVTPTSPTVAFKIGQKVNDPLSMYLNDIFTLPVNISGLPGISLPCGLSEGLPVGLQVIANSYQEATMFRVAAAYERATKHHELRPKVAA